nr:hypothetical protein [uncultured Desulfobulbus sp.]
MAHLQQALLIDDYADGKDTGIIDLILIGDIDTTNPLDLTTKTERYIKQKIRTLTLTMDEYEKNAAILNNRPEFVLWNLEDNKA